MSFKEKLINELKKLNKDYADWSKKTDLDKNDVIKFWKSNGTKVKDLVKENKFTLDDFDIITEFIDNMFKYCFIGYDSWQIEEFQDILKAQIALSFQYNARIEKYLYKFNSKSSYFKKIKALSLIRFTKGSIDDLKYIFGELCLLISDVIEETPEDIEECNNIIKEYINILHTSGVMYGNLWDDIIMNYSSHEERVKIISDKNLHERLYNIYTKKHDDYELNRKWLDKKIENMINYMRNNGYRNIPEKKVIENKLKPLFKEYDALEKEYNELSKINAKYTSFEDGDTRGIYTEGKEFLPHYDEEGFPGYKNIKRFIVAFDDNIPNDKQDKIIKDLKKKYKLNFVNENNANINVRLEEKIRNICSGLEYYTEEIINELVKICSNNPEDINYNDEFDENKDKLLKMQEMIDSLLKDNADLQKKDEEKEKKLNDLYSKKAELESIIEKNPNINANDILDKDIKDRRKEYKITIIGGADKSIKWYKYNMKNQNFLNRLHNEFYLDETKINLKGTFKQQKDKKFKSTIEDDLIFDRAHMIIVLQTDHETEFKNRLDEVITDRTNPYRHRVTEFGELEDDGKIRYNNQKFTPDRFYHYLEKALNKYELHQENNNIGL